MRGQLSAEMIILVAVILAVVAIVALSMTSTANKGSAAIGNQSDQILNHTSDIVSNFSAQVPATQPVAELAAK
ncbi:Uncharacterised protein [uncultured archaeon]|nr:Uncharacterised protein [uncultured archaeon]